MRVRILPEARAELRAAALWYDEKSRGLGAEFVALVDAALRRIALQPEAAPCWRADRAYRVKLVRGFPFSIFFRIRSGAVEVVAVAHQKRRPAYWLGR